MRNDDLNLRERRAETERLEARFRPLRRIDELNRSILLSNNHQEKFEFPKAKPVESIETYTIKQKSVTSTQQLSETSSEIQEMPMEASDGRSEFDNFD